MQSVINGSARRENWSKPCRLLWLGLLCLSLSGCSSIPPSVVQINLPDPPANLLLPMPPLPSLATDSTIGQLTVWAIDVVGQYSACVDRSNAWASFYSGLQAAQLKP